MSFKVIALIAALPALAAAAAAQNPPPGTPAGQIQQLIDGSGMRTQLLQRLRASGMSADQIRQRLAQLGYDPATLDPYLTDQGAAPDPSERARAAYGALSQLLVSATPSPATPAAAQPLPAPTAEERAEDLRVFGLSVFTRTTTQFQPVTTGPVPDTYVLGPGDELVLILTGDVEASYTLPITRDGFIVIPQVGQVPVNGITLARLREQLFGTLGRAYSGIRRGPGATTRFEVTLGNLRTNQIFVTGEVAQPGSYLISPVASVLNALYLAGGPTANATFRGVQIVRGGRVVYRVDLYRYLLEGNNMDSVRLQPGDVIFVPQHGPHVAVRGAINRPAIYEMAPGENLFQLIRFAGGLGTGAHTRRARIARILPAAEREAPGVARVVIDAPLAEVLSDSTRAPALAAGDDVTFFPVRSDVRNTVGLEGAVWQPGSYEFRPGMRLWDLIQRGEGLTPSAYRARAHITRINLRDSTLSLVAVSLDTAASGTPLENPMLLEFDNVRVYDVARPGERLPVTIGGQVYNPGSSEFREGLTLRDLIIRAGGLTPQAHLEIEVARLAPVDVRGSGQLADVIRVRVDSSFIVTDEALRYYLGNRDSLLARAGGDAAAFQLQPYDRVSVRRIPDFDVPGAVEITGEVRFPGNYVVSRRSERLRALLVERSGGLTAQAYPGGARFFRRGNLVNINFTEVLRRDDAQGNVVLEAGDSIHVPAFNPIVRVEGAVHSPTAVLYREGAGMDYYIATAGGFTRVADEGRVHVRYANGEGRAAGRTLWLFRNYPTPGPGSVVSVPAKDPSDRFDWRGFMGDALQIIASVTTILIVANR